MKTRAFILVNVHWIDNDFNHGRHHMQLEKKIHFKESSSIWHSVNWSQISLFNVLKNSLTSPCEMLNIKKSFQALKGRDPTAKQDQVLIGQFEHTQKNFKNVFFFNLVNGLKSVLNKRCLTMNICMCNIHCFPLTNTLADFQNNNDNKKSTRDASRNIQIPQSPPGFLFNKILVSLCDISKARTERHLGLVCK